MSRIPILLMSDGITSPTGLGRITRELAQRIHVNLSETFELGTLGYGGNTSREYPWQQYSITKMSNWAVNDLPAVWKDFAGDRRGVLMSIWNPSWLPWLANPTLLPKGDLKNMLLSDPFEKWLYAPIDAEGPNGKLCTEVGTILKGFDRVLAYTDWAAKMINCTNGLPEGTTEHLPHGIDTKVFYPRDKKEAREGFVKRVVGADLPGIKPDVFLVGIVATNTQRKDWGLAFEACAELLSHGANVGLWIHTDQMKKHWNLEELSRAFGMEGRIIPSNIVLSDEDMAWAYSACDVVWGVGSGEGFGYCPMESLACGVPVVSGDYAAAAEIIPKQYLVKPTGFYWDGFYANRRPIFSAHEWATVTLRAAYQKAAVPDYIKWDVCWPEWEQWFLAGVNG